MKSYIKSDRLFLIPFGVWAYFSMYQISFMFQYIESIYVPLSLLCMSILVIRECFCLKEYKRKDYIEALVTIFCIYISFKLAQGTVMYSCFCIFCARHTDIKKVLKMCFLFSSLGLITIVLASQIGIIEDFILDDGRSRHYLGFLYALEPSTIFFNISALWVYLRKRNITWKELLVIAAINYYFYFMTDSRLCFYFTWILIICAVILKYKYESILKLNVLKWLMSGSIILSTIFSFGVTMSYSDANATMVKLNEYSENRLKKGKQSIEKNGFTILEHNIEFTGNGMDPDGNISKEKNNYVDSFYIQYVQRYGILFMGLIIGLYTRLLFKLKRKNQIYLLMIFSLLAIHGIVDDLIFTLYYNSFLILISYLPSE